MFSDSEKEEVRQWAKKGESRMQAAAAGIPDRIPVVGQMHEFAMIYKGISSETMYQNPQIFFETIIRTTMDLDLDYPYYLYDVYNIELEALGQNIFYPENASPVFDTTDNLIKKRTDLNKLKVPELPSAGRIPFVLDMLREVNKNTGVTPPLMFCAPFSLAMELRGYENLINDIYEEPSFVHSFMEFLTVEVLAPYIQLQKKVAPEATVINGADAWASPPLLTLDMLEEFAVPYVLKLRELCGKEVVVLNWWGESKIKNPEDLLNLKLKVVNGHIRAQDPDVEKLGPELFKEFALRHSISLSLGVGATAIKSYTIEELERKTRNYVAIGSEGGRFYLYLCNLDADIPKEKIHAIVRVAHACRHG